MTAATLICPHCSGWIYPEERCPSRHGLGQCFEKQGHRGYHWTQLGEGSVHVWTGLHVRRSCPGRLDLDRWCEKPPGHSGAHHYHGISFSDPEPDDAAVRRETSNR